MFERLFERGKFTEKDAIKVMKSVLKGVAYLHEKKIVHRGKNERSTTFITLIYQPPSLKLDMKPENLLFKTPESTADLVICDFG